ncbi:hypothetical protein [Massilia sp. NR 4-1]|uniref:hypothetical protein n=1 Tax=Massilia sp. NR 4-1 TaxID=1678028 RepID=UPI00067B6B9D|nr:hypothetical protein [Massilia sp. NR 4-1]AKU20769.1 hypothetical protein ACZ75_03855 [Massilia sp. NR 4-1]
MTLLITAAGKEFALSTSDMRISRQVGKRVIPVDEKFNKHIVFYSNGFRADITYTGIAQWVSGKQTVNLYDVISDSLRKSCAKGLNLGPLCLKLVADLIAVIGVPKFRTANGKLQIELHIIGYHEKLDCPLIAVISSLRDAPPWFSTGENQWEFKFPDLNFYFKYADTPELVIGGMHTAVTPVQRQQLHTVLCAGADAFNTSKLSSEIIEDVSRRTPAVGSRSVSVLLPLVGMMDTNLWDKTTDGIVGYIPRMVFPKGEPWGPSEFPVTLDLIGTGYLDKQSLFFKSILTSDVKRTLRRRLFRYRKGKLLPGLPGLLILALFGSLPDEYTDFGLNHEEEETA